jgi:hypothetical protein
MRLHVVDACELGHVGRAGAAEHLVGHTVDASQPSRFFADAEKEIVGVDGGPRADGTMDASGLASLLTDLHHSSSVSIETGSHTFALLPRSLFPPQCRL